VALWELLFSIDDRKSEVLTLVIRYRYSGQSFQVDTPRTVAGNTRLPNVRITSLRKISWGDYAVSATLKITNQNSLAGHFCEKADWNMESAAPVRLSRLAAEHSGRVGFEGLTASCHNDDAYPV
jgi:hypothetical protein